MTKDVPQSSSRGSAGQKPRQRRWAPRVRTGCISCRASHVKCDEKRPSCSRCAAKGRVCQRVPQPSHPAAAAGAGLVRQRDAVSTPFPWIPEAHERQLFYLFRQDFILEASAGFESDFWSRASLIACQQYPAVWHAAVAIAALHRRGQRSRCGVNHGAEASAKAARNMDDHLLALTHCSKAMRCLMHLERGAVSCREQEMVLITSLLLARYYRLRRQSSGSLIHVGNGLRLLRQWGCWKRASEMPRLARAPDCVAPLTTVLMPFLWIEQQLYGSPLRMPVPYISQTLGQAKSLRSDAFSSIGDACKEIISILMSYRRFYGIGSKPPASAPHLQAHYESYCRFFDVWRRKFDAFRLAQGISAQNEFGRAAGNDRLQVVRIMIVKVYELAVIVMLKANVAKGSSAWDEVTLRSKRVVDLSETALDHLRLLRGRHSDSWLSPFPMLSEPLQVIGLACRDNVTQQRAIALLKAHPHHSGFFGSPLLTQLVSLKADVERMGWCEAPVEGGCECRPGGFICGEHRIKYITAAEEPCPREGYVTLILTTGLDDRRGIPGKRYSVPCFSDAGIEESQ